MVIGTDLKRSASNLKPTFSAATILCFWNVWLLSNTPKTYNDLYWFEEVCFESETNVLCNNNFICLKRLIVVNYDKSLWWSVLIWRGLLRIWNLRFLQQPFSYCETSQGCPWQQKPRIIGTDLKGSASKLKPTVSATTFVLIMKRLSVVHYSQNQRSSVLIWRGLLQIWNQRFLQQLFLNVMRLHVVLGCRSPGWSVLIGRSASKLKPTFSATTILSLWHVSVLFMPTNT